jgi:hypothetical protein
LASCFTILTVHVRRVPLKSRLKNSGALAVTALWDVVAGHYTSRRAPGGNYPSVAAQRWDDSGQPRGVVVAASANADPALCLGLHSVVVSILTDLRWAARQFRRRPGIPLIIVLSLGSAMGISSSLFAVVNAAWFKPWPVPDAARLHVIAARVSTDEWRSWPRESRTFSGLAAERSGEFTRLDGQVLHTHLVSANYFQVLRVPMAMGRTPTPDDASDAAGISYELWQRRFRTDPDIA